MLFFQQHWPPLLVISCSSSSALLLLFLLSFNVRVAMRFTAKTRGYLKCKISPGLHERVAYVRTYGRSSHNQNFLDAWIVKFSYLWCFARCARFAHARAQLQHTPPPSPDGRAPDSLPPPSASVRTYKRTVTWMPKFLGWMDNKIFLGHSGPLVKWYKLPGWPFLSFCGFQKNWSHSCTTVG